MISMKYSFVCEEDGKNIKRFLSENIDGFSLAKIDRQLKLGEIRINGKKTRENILLSFGDKVDIFIPESMVEAPVIETVYEDDNIIVVFKPVNTDTENNLVRLVSSKIGLKVFAVHRLDRNTEGLVILAKDRETESLLMRAIKERKIIKTYRALLSGTFENKKFTATAYLKKDEKAAKVNVFSLPVSGAKEIVTRFETVAEYAGYSDVEIELVTGRTHQIRAHAAFLGHPVLGDGKYSTNSINNKFGFKRQQLRAVKLVFGGCKGKLEYLNGKVIKV